jgi:hypothetical protein
MKGLLSERLHIAKGIDPVADAFAGTVYSDIHNMRDVEGILFVLYVGVGATGTSTLTVEACDNVTPSNATAIPFWYRNIAATDVNPAMTRVAATGYTTVAGSSKIVVVEARADDMGATGYGYIRIKAVEIANDPNLGGIVVILGDLRSKEAAFATKLV